MQTIYIYNKNDLNVVTQIPAKSLKDFENDKKGHFPFFMPEVHFYFDELLKYPIFEGTVVREMTKEELYSQGKYRLAPNELVEDGKIKTVELSECEYVENNVIKLNREKRIEQIKKELYELRLAYDVAPFEFEVGGVKYLQNNRSIDQSNLTRIVLLCQAKQKNTFENWKFYTKEGSEKYESLTLLDMMKMAEIMEKQTTLAMVTETWLNHELETLADTELKNYESETRYKQKYNEIKEV